MRNARRGNAPMRRGEATRGGRVMNQLNAVDAESTHEQCAMAIFGPVSRRSHCQASTVRLERFQDLFFLGGITYMYDISNERY